MFALMAIRAPLCAQRLFAVGPDHITRVVAAVALALAPRAGAQLTVVEEAKRQPVVASSAASISSPTKRRNQRRRPSRSAGRSARAVHTGARVGRDYVAVAAALVRAGGWLARCGTGRLTVFPEVARKWPTCSMEVGS